jgi:hypothetical protein
VLKADAAVCASGIGAVVGVDRVMNSKDNTVSEDALKLGDIPNSCGSHGMISDGGSVLELGAEASKTSSCQQGASCLRRCWRKAYPEPQ